MTDAFHPQTAPPGASQSLRATLNMRPPPRMHAPVAPSSLPAAMTTATADARIVDVPAWRALALERVGGPRDAAAVDAAAAILRSVADEMAAARAGAGKAAFESGPLECVWCVDERAAAEGRWRARLAVPADLRSHDVTDAVVRLAPRFMRAHRGALLRVVLEEVPQRRLARVLDAGDGGATPLRVLLAAIHEQGLRPGDHWTEVALAGGARAVFVEVR